MDSYLTTMFGLKGKSALVTGGSRGIGRAMAIALASAGANIILLVRDPNDENVRQVAQEIELLGGPQCHFYVCDLSNRSQVSTTMSDMLSHHTVDILVHAAGIQYRCPAEEFPDDEWDKIMEVNLNAGFHLARRLSSDWFTEDLAQFRKPGSNIARKKVVFIASMTTYVGGIDIPAYAASKGAIGQLTKALNNEWMEWGINVNAIAPGYIETDLTRDINDGSDKAKTILDRIPAGRWGQPDDLAGALIHLCSRSGDYIGGEVHAVDGGFLGR